MVIETMAVAVSKIVKLKTAPTDGPTHIDTTEQLMMKTPCPTMHLPCVDKTNTSYIWTSACGVRMSQEYYNNLSLRNVSFILIVVWLLSFIQVTSTMSFCADCLCVKCERTGPPRQNFSHQLHDQYEAPTPLCHF
jgi:hypothetical protein